MHSSKALFLVPAALLLGAAPAPDPMQHARALMRATPLIDGHNDYPWQVRDKAGLDLTKLDLRQPQPTLHTDLARLRAGQLGGQFWSVYVPVEMKGPEATRATMEQIDLVYGMARAILRRSRSHSPPPMSSASSRPARSLR